MGKIRGQLERVSERELAAKERWREAAGAFRRAEEELEEQAEFKRQLLAQVETLFYNEQYAAQPASDEELARRVKIARQGHKIDAFFYTSVTPGYLTAAVEAL